MKTKKLNAHYFRKVNIRITFDTAPIFGPGKALLLENIKETGSISAGARKIGMSYRRAWLLVNSVNESFSKPLVNLYTGGKGGGGAKLTQQGEKVLSLYRKMERDALYSLVKAKHDFIDLL